MIAAPLFPRLVAIINSMRDTNANVPDIKASLCSTIASPPLDLVEEVDRLRAAEPDTEVAIAALIHGSNAAYWDARPHLRAAIRDELDGIANPVRDGSFVGQPRPAMSNSNPDASHLQATPTGSKKQRLRPVPQFVPFPVTALPDPIAAFVKSTAAAIGCDPCMVAMPMLAVLAAAIGSTRRIRIKKTWWEPSIVWAVVVADSGAQKSPGFDAALQPLQKIQDEAMRDYETQQEAYCVEKQLHEAAFADWKRKSSRTPDPPTPPSEPICRRNIVKDATTEAIAPILRDNPHGLLLARDELSGWLRSFDAYKGGRGGDVSTWLELFRGRASTIDRKHGNERVIHVPFGSVSVCGTIQPGALRAALGFEHFADGLAARLLVAMPPRLPRVWTEDDVDPDLVARVESIVAKLLALQMQNGQPVEIELSPGGRAAFKAFYNRHGKEQEGLSGDIAAAWSKLEGYCARFALIIHLLRMAAGETACELIEECDVASAVRLVEWFGREAERVYAMLAETRDESELRELVDVIRRGGGRMTAAELARSGPRRFRGKVEAAEAALKQLVEDGSADWLPVSPGSKGGRPTSEVRLREVDTEPKPLSPPEAG